MILISACLAGFNCRFDGTNKTEEFVIDLIKKGKAIPLCPEQLAGLSTPREPAEQRGNQIFTKIGYDQTKEFLKGAEEALRLCRLYNCSIAILKSKSPSCGSGKVYDGTFSGKLIEKDGVFADLLKKNGIKVFNEKDLCKKEIKEEILNIIKQF